MARFHPLQNFKFSFAVDPVATDDVSAGYEETDTWVNTTTNEAFVCVDNSAGAAIWTSITAPAPIPTGNQIWVDADFGNNTTAQPYRYDLPYEDPWEARLNATTGDVIIVRAGSYLQSSSSPNLWQEQLTYLSDGEVTILYNTSSGNALFQNANPGESCRMTGNFTLQSIGGSDDMFDVTAGDFYLDIKAANPNGQAIGINSENLIKISELDITAGASNGSITSQLRVDINRIDTDTPGNNFRFESPVVRIGQVIAAPATAPLVRIDNSESCQVGYAENIVFIAQSFTSECNLFVDHFKHEDANCGFTINPGNDPASVHVNEMTSIAAGSFSLNTTVGGGGNVFVDFGNVTFEGGVFSIGLGSNETNFRVKNYRSTDPANQYSLSYNSGDCYANLGFIKTEGDFFCNLNSAGINQLEIEGGRFGDTFGITTQTGGVVRISLAKDLQLDLVNRFYGGPASCFIRTATSSPSEFYIEGRVVKTGGSLANRFIDFDQIPASIIANNFIVVGDGTLLSMLEASGATNVSFMNSGSNKPLGANITPVGGTITIDANIA